ncbi:DUF1835 domain-containing protein [Planomicrobium okeanokoites]|uniref:DUF1835 domain-containing protein n=1 Tax=Planomicrobium okeanokoites TaxID=244 RepID=A0ABV7KSH0_PLAOK|nr:DUF1835 domain-containing protein [Planomicrobium okeanokoites]TAA70221.1 DUF1835 domain-containing protein [Planomicrobium okeanokoites]
MNHFVVGESAAGSLKLAFRGKNHQIYPLSLDLSLGPIAAIHEEEGIQRHVDWLRSSFTFEDDYFGHQEETYRQTLEKIKSLKDGDQATIWTGENTAEQIGLRLVCFLMANKKVDLSVVNTAEAMNELMRDSDIEVEIRHSGECNNKQMAHFFKHSRTRLPNAETVALADDMLKLLSSTSLLRSWKNGEILDAEETRDDSFILKCVRGQKEKNLNDGFVKATRIVGEVLGHSYHIYSDAWIDYRLRSLTRSGQLISRGDLRSMRSYDVRLAHEEV